MLRRIVRLSIQPQHCDQFIDIFEATKTQIRSFPGCTHLELWRAREPDHIFMTYSHWESEEALNQYRYSELFQSTWPKVKVLFADKPKAWSLDLQSQVAPS